MEWVALESFGLFSLNEEFLKGSIFKTLDVGSLLHLWDRVVLRIVLSPASCILSSFALFVLAGVHHQVEAYSKTGLTDPV